MERTLRLISAEPGRPACRATIEALLVVASAPLSVEELAAAAADDAERIETALGAARRALPRGPQRHRARARRRRLGLPGGARGRRGVRAAVRAAGRARALAGAALETLAIVAYLGPCTRPEIARMRGVAVDSVVAGLVERGLIAEAGRDDRAGGAVRYRTTPLFERVFGLESLSELPRLDDLGGDADEIRERLDSRRREAAGLAAATARFPTPWGGELVALPPATRGRAYPRISRRSVPSSGRTRNNCRMRLNAYLARAGVASRRGADELIKAGRVRVNGEPGQLNTFVATGDLVELDGRPLAPTAPRVPSAAQAAGVVTTARDPQGGRRSSSSSRPSRGSSRSGASTPTPPARSCSRTTATLAHRLAHPRYEVEKVYEAEVEGDPDEAALARLERGVELDDGPTAPPRARPSGRLPVELAIHQGRKHQVKRMLEAVGHPVRRLHRTRYAGLDLAGLAPGRWRELTETERQLLRQ